MADIKTREVVRGTIKTLDRAGMVGHRIKDVTVKTKRGVQDVYESSGDSPSEYAVNKYSSSAEVSLGAAKDKAFVVGRQNAMVTKDNLIKGIRQRQIRKANAASEELMKETASTTKHTYKKGLHLAKTTYVKKTIAKSAETKRKTREVGIRTKKAIKGFLKSIRVISSNIKNLIIGLSAVGWVSAIMIAVTIFVGGTFNTIDVLSVDSNQPGMDEWDHKYLEEILEEYPNAYIGPGDGNIVNVALSQVGNVGGRRYWYWYGFKSRVEWCCCFVSWCADQCGYIKAGIIPKFAGTVTGVNFFRKHHQWNGRNYRPRAGDIIFFTWNNDGVISHVGIVKACDGKVVYTVEGNSGDKCREKSYVVGSRVIYGYGSPAYE